MHSPLPWKHSLTDDTVVIDATGNEVAAIDGDYNQPDLWPIMEANAALIVRACNVFEALTAALAPFAATAENDIGETEDDKDLFWPTTQYNRSPPITVGDLRKARAALALAGEHGAADSR